MTGPRKPPQSVYYDPIPESVAEATAQLAVRCESHPHEFIRNRRCAWCGKEQSDDA